MTADQTPPPPERKPPAGDPATPGGERGNRSRRRSGRGGGRGRQEARDPARSRADAPRQDVAPAPAGQAARPATPGGSRPDGRGRGQERAPERAPERGQEARAGRPPQTPPQGGNRPSSGRGGQQQQQQGGRGREGRETQDPARARRRDQETVEAPDLAAWSFEHLGYTAWMAHAQILPTATPERAVRTYIVDIHVDEDAVNPRLWPAIQPLLDLEVTAADAAKGARALAEAFRHKAGETGLPPADQYRQVLPPVEATVSSPVQAALDTAMNMDLDHPQEDIDVMNEGRRGQRLTPRT